MSEAFDGINSQIFYQTPADFYRPADDDETDAADTAVTSAYVLSQDGTGKAVSFPSMSMRQIRRMIYFLNNNASTQQIVKIVLQS